ncbi:hypothetical protein HI914_03213 [Erysiphe necator]|nr:hypothetical protein HI914_03213 [Erysiphe necator]
MTDKRTIIKMFLSSQASQLFPDFGRPFGIGKCGGKVNKIDQDQQSVFKNRTLPLNVWIQKVISLHYRVQALEETNFNWRYLRRRNA